MDWSDNLESLTQACLRLLVENHARVEVSQHPHHLFHHRRPAVHQPPLRTHVRQTDRLWKAFVRQARPGRRMRQEACRLLASRIGCGQSTDIGGAAVAWSKGGAAAASSTVGWCRCCLLVEVGAPLVEVVGTTDIMVVTD